MKDSHIRSKPEVFAQPGWRSLRALLRCGEDGSALIEFSLCLPPVLLLMTGIFVFGINIGNYVMLTNATGAATLQLSLSRGQTLDPCSTVATAVTNAAPSLKSANLTYTTVINGTSYSGSTCASSSSTTGAAGVLSLASTQQASVTVTYPCNLAVFGANNFPNCILTAKSSEMVQ
jgi:Flp pilus assembly protein TadG